MHKSGIFGTFTAIALLLAPVTAHAGLLGNALNKALGGLNADKTNDGPPGGTAKVERPERFKGLTKVVMGQFTVGFFVKHSSEGKMIGMGGAGEGMGWFGKVRGDQQNATLDGVEFGDFQAATDDVYTTFKRQMAARGIEIVDPSGYTASPGHSHVRNEEAGREISVNLSHGNGTESARARLFWPSDLGRRENALITLGGWDGGMAQGAAQMAELNYAKATNIPVMNVLIYVDFFQPSTDRHKRGENTTQSVLRISNYGTLFNVVTADDSIMSAHKGGSIILQSPVVLERTRGNVSSNDSTITANITVNNAEGHKSAIVDATSKLGDLFFGEMQSLR